MTEHNDYAQQKYHKTHNVGEGQEVAHKVAIVVMQAAEAHTPGCKAVANNEMANSQANLRAVSFATNHGPHSSADKKLISVMDTGSPYVVTKDEASHIHDAIAALKVLDTATADIIFAAACLACDIQGEAVITQCKNW